MLAETKALATFAPDALKILKAVLSVAQTYGDGANTEPATATYREEMDNVVVDTAQKLEQLEQVMTALMKMVVRQEDWKNQSTSERPTSGDVAARAEEFARASVRAGSHGKRKILWNAFFSSFKPEFYRGGWSGHMWRIAEQIEYPECYFLAKCLAESKPQLLTTSDEDYYLAERLKDLGLATLIDPGRDLEAPLPRVHVFVTDISRRFKQFVWDEDMGRDEPLSQNKK